MDYLKQRVELSTLYTDTPASGTVVTVCGWAKTVRDSKKIGFISLTDGSCYKPVQVVFEADLPIMPRWPNAASTQALP